MKRQSASRETHMLTDQLLERMKKYLPVNNHIEAKKIREKLNRLLHSSHYAVELCRTWPHLLECQFEKGTIYRSLSTQSLTVTLKKQLDDAHDETSLMKKLRLFRHSHMLRILWRDINRISSISDTMRELSILAQCCLDEALNWLYKKLTVSLGTPLHNGKEQHLVILGMGKLGGYELNFSSDIDLIFCYPSSGQTSGGPRTVENHVFFNRLGQSLVRIMDTITIEGFVYRMDMRLRPYGKSGALALSFGAMEQYYQDQGREWERYALIKARSVAGDKISGNRLLKSLKPFIYRRYLDFSTIDSLRSMKSIIHQNILSKDRINDIKKGTGGIREIEFIVQSFQLIYGGKKPQLQHQGLIKALEQINNLKLLPGDKAAHLKDTYYFLRRVEHLLQAWKNTQTQKIPATGKPLSILSTEMGFDHTEAFLASLKEHRNFVETLFISLLEAHTPLNNQEINEWKTFWESKEITDGQRLFLETKKFKDADSVLMALEALKVDRRLQTSTHQARETINRFIPLLLLTCEQHTNPTKALLRTLPVVERVTQRTAYLKFLLEKPEALKHLIQLCHDSMWIVNQVATHPVLLDEFLNPENLYEPPPISILKDELSRQLAPVEPDNIEAKVKSLCYFKMAHLLKCAVATTTGNMPLMAVSNYLSAVAECVIHEIANLSWSIFINKYGWPGGTDKNEKPFIIIAYGKLGGLETGPDSDLDLVFIHDTDIQENSTGERSIDNQTFFARFAQKVIHLLTLQTTMGKLYEVDIRLRPSGNSGLLVSSFGSFSTYHKNAAWIWECQAMVRARIVSTGSGALSTKFIQLRNTVLQKKRERNLVQHEIKNMRKKMEALDQSSKNRIDLKYGRGCIVDIEFLVQYLVLVYAQKHPALLKWTDNMRLLDESLKANLLSEEETGILQNTYLTFRDETHRQAFDHEDHGNSQEKDFKKERARIIKLWNKQLHDDLSLSF